MTRRMIRKTAERSQSQRVRVDPVEWAARRKKAMALAKSLREERKYGIQEINRTTKNSLPNDEGSFSNELGSELIASPRSKAVVTPLTEDDDTAAEEKSGQGSNHPVLVEDEYCRPLSSSLSSADTSILDNNSNEKTQNRIKTGHSEISSNAPSSSCGAAMSPAGSPEPRQYHPMNQQSGILLPSIEQDRSNTHNRCDTLLLSSSKRILQRVEGTQEMNNQMVANLSRSCSSDIIPSAPTSLKSTEMPKLSRARRRLQTALLYPLTEDTFNEAGKLSLLQQRLMFRRKRAGHSSLNGDMPATPRGKMKKKPPWVNAFDAPPLVDDTSGSPVIAKFQHNICMEKSHPPEASSVEPIDPSRLGLESPVQKYGMEAISTSNNDTTNAHAPNLSELDEYVEIKRIHCDKCGKSFAPEVHEKICKLGKCIKMFKSKRKVFSSAKMRIMGNPHLNTTEKAAVIDSRRKIVMEKKAGGGSFKRNQKHDGKWKAQSAEFREAMKANRLIAKAKKEGKPAHYYL